MCGFVFALMLAVFLAMLVLVGWGFARHARTANKIFELTHRELDRRLAEAGKPTEAADLKCEHCGSQVPAGPVCPNCGARLTG